MECANEYRMIFEKAIESQRPSGNLEGSDWFQKFKEGWEAIEREKNLAPIEIPEEIRAYYHRIWGIVPEDDTKGSK